MANSSAPISTIRPRKPFDSEHTGLDHVSFAVNSREDLERAAALDNTGIGHGEVRDLADAGIAILPFQDPDDISVELTAALG